MFLPIPISIELRRFLHLVSSQLSKPLQSHTWKSKRKQFGRQLENSIPSRNSKLTADWPEQCQTYDHESNAVNHFNDVLGRNITDKSIASKCCADPIEAQEILFPHCCTFFHTKFVIVYDRFVKHVRLHIIPADPMARKPKLFRTMVSLQRSSWTWKQNVLCIQIQWKTIHRLLYVLLMPQYKLGWLIFFWQMKHFFETMFWRYFWAVLHSSNTISVISTKYKPNWMPHTHKQTLQKKVIKNKKKEA